MRYATIFTIRQKFTDHYIQSPLNNIANSCQVCHREEADRLIKDVYLRQDKDAENRYDSNKFFRPKAD